MTDWSELRYLREDDTIGVVHRLRTASPLASVAATLREKVVAPERPRQRARAAFLNEGRGSKRLEEAAQRLGELLRSERLETTEWADTII